MLSLWACTGDSEGSGKKAGGTGRKARSGFLLLAVTSSCLTIAYFWKRTSSPSLYVISLVIIVRVVFSDNSQLKISSVLGFSLRHVADMSNLAGRGSSSNRFKSLAFDFTSFLRGFLSISLI